MNEPDAPQTYEIDLRVWGRRIWAARRPVLAVAAAFTIGYWAVWAAWQVKEPTVYSLSRVVQFPFEGAGRNQYPDGSTFRVTDVIAPDVLSAVHDESGLDAQVISRRDFITGFHIQPVESGASDRSAARLLFTGGAKETLSAEQIGALLLDVPRQWSEQALDRGAAFEPMVSLPTSRIFDKTLHDKLDYFELVRKLRRDTEMVRHGILRMENLPGGKTARDEGHTGLTLEEIHQATRHAEEYLLNRAFDYINALGLTKNPDTAARIRNLEGRMQRYEADRRSSQKKAEARRAAFRLYSETVPRPGSVSVIESDPDGSEADGRLPDWIAAPTLAAEDVEWRQAFINKLLTVELRRTHREGDIIKMKNLIDKLRSGTIENRAWYVARVEADIAEFERRIRDLVDALGRIGDRIREQHPGHRGSLYLSPNPVEAVPVSGAPPFDRAVRPYFLLLFGAMVSVLLIILLVRRPKEAHREEDGGTTAGG